MYVVILAGGGGTRLWPLSRPETPKPFLPLLGDDSLLQRTVARVVGHAPLGIAAGDVTVVTDRRYATLVRAQCPGVQVIAEPAGRNTAAAIALATLTIDRPADDVMCVLPADHAIADEGQFRETLAAVAYLATGALGVTSPLITLGIETDRPATEYGYLIPRRGTSAVVQDRSVSLLDAFEEKPTHDRALVLRDMPEVFWNAGIFAWQRAAIRDALERYTGLVTLLEPVCRSGSGLDAAYGQAHSISIDRAVMERAASDGQVLMTAMDVGWNDLGSWSALLAAIGAQGSGRVVQANEPADAGANDLVIEREGGRLVVGGGPRGILATTPTALLRDAAPSLGAVEALVDRVRRWEELS